MRMKWDVVQNTLSTVSNTGSALKTLEMMVVMLTVVMVVVAEVRMMVMILLTYCLKLSDLLSDNYSFFF